MIRSKFTK